MEKNEGSATESFLGELGEQKKDVFSQTQDDPFAPTEKEEVKGELMEEAKEEKPVPYHKDEKLQRYVEKQVNKRIEAIKSSATEQFIKEVTEEDPFIEAFTNVLGNDTPEKVSALKELKKTLERTKEEAAKRAYDKFAEENKQAKEQERQTQEFLETQFEEIEEQFNVDLSSSTPQARKTRNEFIDFVKKIAPKDTDGEITEFPDMVSTFEIFKDRQQKPVTNNRAKELASRGMARSTEATAPTRRISWDNIDSLLGLDQ